MFESRCLFPAQIILQEGIFRTLAGILHLGNVEFSSGKEHDSSVVKDRESRFHLQMAADLFKYISFFVKTIFRLGVRRHSFYIFVVSL